MYIGLRLNVALLKWTVETGLNQIMSTYIETCMTVIAHKMTDCSFKYTHGYTSDSLPAEDSVLGAEDRHACEVHQIQSCRHDPGRNHRRVNLRDKPEQLAEKNDSRKRSMFNATAVRTRINAPS